MSVVKASYSAAGALPWAGKGAERPARTASGIRRQTGCARMPARWSIISAIILWPKARRPDQSAGSRVLMAGGYRAFSHPVNPLYAPFAPLVHRIDGVI